MGMTEKLEGVSMKMKSSSGAPENVQCRVLKTADPRGLANCETAVF